MNRCSMNRCSIIVLVLLKFLQTFQAQTQTLENVALGKTCNESTIYMENYKGNDCRCAINGNKGTTYIIGDCSSTGNCIHTDPNDRNTTWSLDLGRAFTIQKITVIGRDGPFGLDRMKYVVVYVDQTWVYRFTNTPNIVTDIDSQSSSRALPRSGRVVTLSFSTSGGLLNICEVEVWVISACTSNPCQHGGTCQTTSDDVYTCTCPQGYTGTECQTDTDECTSNPCSNGGTCNDAFYSYTCTCRRGYTGANCQININECAPNPCVNGGTCADGVASYTCTCRPGYTGTNCQTDINECAPNPCVNGGTCIDGVASYTCTCRPGYTGFNCQTNINDCAPNPCQNGGWCTDGVTSYTCNCLPGYTGKNCQTDMDDCAPNPCLNNGTCSDRVASYSCTCSTGYTGRNCQTDFDECFSSPCHNGGNCTDYLASYTCTCPGGYTGSNCETDIKECAPNPCINGGTCTDRVASYSCICLRGYTGEYCQTDPNDCESEPCAIGWTCTDGVAAYTCTCPSGYNGTHCGTDIDDCASSPCDNGGTCTDGVGSYSCDYLHDNHETERCPQNSAGTIAGAFFGGAAMSAFVLILGFRCWKRRTVPSQTTENKKGDPSSSELPYYNQGPTTSIGLEPDKYNQEARVSTYNCDVRGDNTYDALHPYSNDGKPERDVYTQLDK